MQRRSLFLIGVVTLAIVLGGCRTMPVHNVTDAPVTVNKASYTTADVRRAILRAGGGLGWQMREEKPGLIVGKLALRSHVAVVDVVYNKNTYAIKYRDSTNLGYDGTNIHKNYNGWVQNLDRAILTQLQTL